MTWKAAEERHQEGGRHWHVIAFWERPLRSRKVDVFDIDGIHPHIQMARQTPKDLDRMWEYIHKEEGGMQWGPYEGPIKVDTSIKTKRGQWSYIVDADNEEEFRERVRRIDPQAHVLQHDKIASYVRKTYGKAEEEYEPKWTEFPWLPQECREWVAEEMAKTDRPKTLVLWGPSRTGKTEWARSLGSHNYFNGLFNIDDFDEGKDYVVFDDVSYDYFPNYKGWLGAQKSMVLTDKYRGKRTVKWGKPCIWLHNSNPMVEANGWDKAWLEANAVIVELPHKLYGEVDPRVPRDRAGDPNQVYLEDIM